MWKIMKKYIRKSHRIYIHNQNSLWIFDIVEKWYDIVLKNVNNSDNSIVMNILKKNILILRKYHFDIKKIFIIISGRTYLNIFYYLDNWNKRINIKKNYFN